MNYDSIEIEKELKIVFMGTPDFCIPILEGLIENYKIRAIVTQKDRKTDRNGNIIFNPVKKFASDHTILTIQPEKITEAVDEIIALEPDIIITCAYGQILPKELLDYPRYGCINIHASLLPKLRGGAPIHRAIMNGFKTTGVTIMYMDPKMDAGDIIYQKEVEITYVDTAETLHDKLSMVGRDLLLESLPKIFDGTAPRIKQDSSKVTYGFVIKREDEKIDFDKTKKEIYNKVRGLNSWPGAYCMLEGKILKVWNVYETENVFPNLFNGQITKVYNDGFGVKVSNGEIVFTVVQPEGKKKMSAVDFINGQVNIENIEGKILD